MPSPSDLVPRMLSKGGEPAARVLAALEDGVVAVDATGGVLYLNPAAERLTGWSRGEAQGLPISAVLRVVSEGFGRGVDVRTIAAIVRDQRATGTVGNSRLINRSDTEIPIDYSITPSADGGAVVLFHDLSHGQELRRRLVYQASHDLLTGLPNRFTLQQFLREVHLGAQARGGAYTVMLIDLDHFKVVNDSCGHAVGDEVLVQAAERMRASVRSQDRLGRWGGEEFLCVLPDTARARGLEVAERIRRSQDSGPMQVGDHTLRVTASIGVASFPADAEALEPLLTKADAALYEAKRLGRNRVGSAERVGDSIFSVAGQIESALASDRLRPAYQDIVDLSSGEVVADQALARIVRPDGTIMEASEFLGAYERVQLTHRIDLRVALHTLRRCVFQTRQGARPRAHFVNISADFLRRQSLVDEVLAAVKESCGMVGSPAGAQKPLVIEVTEREFLDDVDEARRVLQPFTDFGLRLALGGFGSGYSSLSYLAALPVAFLKLETGMVRRVHREPRVRSILRGIQDMAADLGVVTIAEGIEDEATADTLRRMGVDWGQGYHFAAPALG